MRSLALAVALVAALLPAPSAASASWRWPVDGRLVTPYRNGADPYAGGQHRGIDIAAPTGTPVVAAAAGTITFAGLTGSSGLTVAVRTDDGYDTSYLHLSAIRVRAGDRVAAGEELGAVGTTGRRSAVPSHLHFGVREAGSRFAYRDPLDFLPGPPPSRKLPRPAPLPVAIPVAPRAEPVPGPPAVAPVTAVHLAEVVPALGPGLDLTGAPVVAPAVAGAPRPSLRRSGQAYHRAGLRSIPRQRAAAVRAPGRTTDAPRKARTDHRRDARSAVPRPAAGPGAVADRTAAGAWQSSHPAGARHGLPAGGRGLDLGWLAACVGMVVAATLLGRPRARSLRRVLGHALPSPQPANPDRP